MNELMDRLRGLLPHETPDDTLLLELLALSREAVFALTGRNEMPEGLTGAQLRLAVIAFNRLGTEGERARREGSMAITFDGLPDDLMKLLRAWRVARVTP